ncbi:hypothetical protein D3C84_1221610 [compost metagenome]
MARHATRGLFLSRFSGIVTLITDLAVLISRTGLYASAWLWNRYVRVQRSSVGHAVILVWPVVMEWLIHEHALF